MKTLNQYIDEWIDKIGNIKTHEDANLSYAKEILPKLLDRIYNEDKVGRELREAKVDTLFSVLGKTPAPIVMTQHALQPRNHIIFYDKNITVTADPILAHLSSNPVYVCLKDDSFGSIYEAMKEMLIVSDGGNFAIDITGEKKSMTAAASIFAKDFDFNIVYVDMENPDDYIPAIHQLRPGTERLNLVYSPLHDLPELFH